MSGLILEGELEKKFGKNFPTPIIDQVSVFDNRLEVDVSIYFRVPNDDPSDVMEFLRVFDSQELQLVIGAPKENLFKPVSFGSSSPTYDYSITNDAFGMLSGDKIFSPPVNINSDDFEKDINIYTDTGQRYCRLKTTVTLMLVFFGGGGLSLIRRAIQNIIAFTYSKNIYSFFSSTNDNLGNFLDDYQILKPSLFNTKEESIDELNLLTTQTSDISHVKVFNSAGGIEQTKINVFLDENEQVYSGQVLYSLARTYHKALDFTKETIETGVKAIVSNYEQIVSEDTPLEDSMNNILFLLETEKDNPKLLTILNDANKASPYKSSALPVGKFYKDLNTFFFESNRRVIAQEELTLRQFDNVNIVDFREVDLPQEVVDSEFYYQEESDLIFITEEMCVRGLSNFEGRGRGGGVTVFPPTNINDTLFFVDVDKAIAEKSEISKFVNTTFINILFNNKDINNFFYPSEVIVKKSSGPLSRFGGISQYVLDPITKHFTYEIFESGKRDQTSCAYFYNLELGETKTSFLAERNVHLNRREVQINSINYPRDIRTYNIFEGGDGTKWEDNYYYHITVKFTDNTMTFYDYAIRKRFLDILNKVRRYEDLADDFCSYNNLDGSFNDFFKNSIEAQFSEPYPWVEAPYFYTLIYQLLLKEGRQDPSSYPFENAEIQVPNLTALRSLAFELTDGISPNSGNLNNLRNFVIAMEQLYSRNLAQGNGLDSENEIYLEDSDYEIKKPEIIHTKVKSLELPKTLSFGVEFYDLLNYAYISNFKSYSVSTSAESVILSDIEFFDLGGFMDKYEEFGGDVTFKKIFHEFVNLYKDAASRGGRPTTADPLKAAFGLSGAIYREQMSSGYNVSGVEAEFAEDIRAALRYYTSITSLEMSTGPKYEDMFSLLFLTYLQYVQDSLGKMGSGEKEGMEYAFDFLSSMRGSEGFDEFINYLAESDNDLRNLIWFAEKYNKADILEYVMSGVEMYGSG